jgi:hypothetical protein
MADSTCIRYTSINEDGTRWKECIICFEMRKGVHTEYARKKAQDEASKNAHSCVLNTTDSTPTDGYVFHYMAIYNKVFTQEYNRLFDVYRNEYETFLHKKYRNVKDENEICSYHQESIQWLG